MDVFEIPPSPAQVQEVSNAQNPITAETQLNHPSQSEAGPSQVAPPAPPSSALLSPKSFTSSEKEFLRDVLAEDQGAVEQPGVLEAAQ